MEHLLTDPDYLPELERAWQQYLEAMPPSESPTGTSCLHCSKPPEGKRKLCTSCYRIRRELDLARVAQAELERAGGGAPISLLLMDAAGITPLPRHHAGDCEHGAGGGLPEEGESAPVLRVEFERTCALCKNSFPHKAKLETIPGPQFMKFIPQCPRLVQVPMTVRQSSSERRIRTPP